MIKKQFDNFLRARISDYPVYLNIGPGKDEDPISQITCGYEVGNPGWIALVFDTRRKPAVDGEWTLHIEGNELSVTRWGGNLSSSDAEAKVGEKIRSYLQAAFENRVFASLPVADDCMLTVEENNGAWGWSSHADDSKEAYLAKIATGAQGLDGTKAVSYWIRVLNDVASGRHEDDKWGFLVNSLAFKRLGDIDAEIVMPLLKFADKWSDKPEFNGDRPSRKIKENPMQTPVCQALQTITALAEGSNQELRLLKKVLKKSLEVNDSRKLWGVIPRWSADALGKLFSQYPEPKIDGANNRLKNAGEYT